MCLACRHTKEFFTIAKYFFEGGGGGKKVRPALVLLFARALNGGYVHPAQKRLAEITEMIHTASLLHDDVIDHAETRRGVAAAHQRGSFRSRAGRPPIPHNQARSASATGRGPRQSP